MTARSCGFTPLARGDGDKPALHDARPLPFWCHPGVLSVSSRHHFYWRGRGDGPFRISLLGHDLMPCSGSADQSIPCAQFSAR